MFCLFNHFWQFITPQVFYTSIVFLLVGCVLELQCISVYYKWISIVIGADSVSPLCTSFAINLFPPNYLKQFVAVQAYCVKPVPTKYFLVALFATVVLVFSHIEHLAQLKKKIAFWRIINLKYFRKCTV